MPVRYEAVIIASAGTSGTATPWCPLNQYQSPFNVGFGVTVPAAHDLVYRVEHTFQNVVADASVAATQVFTHADVSAAAVSRDGNYAFPVAAVRLKLTSFASGAGGPLAIKLLQSGV